MRLGRCKYVQEIFNVLIKLYIDILWKNRSHGFGSSSSTNHLKVDWSIDSKNINTSLHLLSINVN